MSLPEGHPDIAAPAAGPRLAWTTPEGWKETPRGEMRVASFAVTDPEGNQADVSVIPLSGSGGGDLGNVNRWRGQVGQPPLTEDELAKVAERVELGGRPAALFDQGGESADGEKTRILAVIQHREGTAWFFKMTGSDSLVAREKRAFVAFLKSFEFGGGAAVPAQTPAQSADSSRPQWTVPKGWQEVEGGQFLVAKFQIAGPSGPPASVNISASAGDGGGLAANVNRWRKQLGLAELSADEILRSATTVDDPGGRVVFVEMSGADAGAGQPLAVVGAVAMRPRRAWFYKLTGEATLVAEHKDAFVAFVRGVKY